MQCPACGNRLTTMTVADVTARVCRGGCGGIWFDWLELRKVDEKSESAGEALLDVERNPDVRVDYGTPRECPRCRGIIMMRHFYSPRRQAEVDECGQCGGFWLDTGELATLRSQYETEAQRRAASRDFAQTILGKELPRLREQIDAEDEVFNQIQRMFRFLCHSVH